MELWQMDVVGGLLLDDGTECKIIDGIDDYSALHCVRGHHDPSNRSPGLRALCGRTRKARRARRDTD